MTRRFGFGRATTAAVPAPGIARPGELMAGAVVGDQPCSERGCPRLDGLVCGYVDRRGRRCGTAWCPDHRSLFDGYAFCRRHAGTVRAIGLDVVPRALAPDLDNRAPSLVNWVCNGLDERMRAFLIELIPRGSPDELGEERVHLIRAAEGKRRWDRSWKVFNHTGVTVKITVSVDEADDTTVIVRDGQRALVKAVPPWIDRRIRTLSVSEGQDEEERRIFYDWIFDRICTSLTRDGAIR
jgi:hypothetical protein